MTDPVRLSRQVQGLAGEVGEGLEEYGYERVYIPRSVFCCLYGFAVVRV